MQRPDHGQAVAGLASDLSTEGRLLTGAPRLSAELPLCWRRRWPGFKGRGGTKPRWRAAGRRGEDDARSGATGVRLTTERDGPRSCVIWWFCDKSLALPWLTFRRRRIKLAAKGQWLRW